MNKVRLSYCDITFSFWISRFNWEISLLPVFFFFFEGVALSNQLIETSSINKVQ